MKMQFAKMLMQWYATANLRPMPWKGECDAYLVWLSEIILQQTRVEQGMPYFLRFKEKYPTVQQLALAHEDEVMRLWQGLGYYSRARNLHATAKFVYNELRGKFPDSYNELLKLKGVGTYTAAAIASLVFDEKKAVVDGNVIRVLARVFGIDVPFDTTEGKKRFAALAQELLNTQEPGKYNQAIMCFGAELCMPQKPLCEVCPFSARCVAFNQEKIDLLPVRAKRTEVKSRFFTYLFIRNETEIWLHKRTENDIWKDLFELPMIETSKPLQRNFAEAIKKYLGNNHFEIMGCSEPRTQLLSHRKIHARFVEVRLHNFKKLPLENAQRAKLSELPRYAFPKTVHSFLSEKNLLSAT